MTPNPTPARVASEDEVERVKLPPLPKPLDLVLTGEGGTEWHKAGRSYYHASDMEKYARAAIAALAQQPAPQTTGEAVAWEPPCGMAPMEHPERDAAEHAYTLSSFDYQRDPVGSHDWQAYWKGWHHRSIWPTPAASGDADRRDALRYRAWRNAFHEAGGDSDLYQALVDFAGSAEEADSIIDAAIAATATREAK